MSESGARKILVVDDEPTVRQSIREALAAEGTRVDSVASGEDALRLEGVEEYGLIIADLMMPGLSGLDLLRKLRERGSSARVVVVTGYPTLLMAQQAVKMGAFEFLAKPFTPADLRAMVERAFAAAKD
jgi:DNA-binding NtrC family response regulator